MAATMTSEGIMVSVRILPEIYDSLNKEISGINSKAEIQWQERKVNKEAVINAILCDFLSRAKNERRALLKSAVKTVEFMLELRNPQEIDEARLIPGRTIEKLAKHEIEEEDED